MKVVSIDVGMKNLALCVFDVTSSETKQIYKWDVLNICESETEVPVCTVLSTKKGKKQSTDQPCGKPGKYHMNGLYYCKSHAKHTPYFIPTDEYKWTNIKKKKLVDLYAYAETHSIPFSKPTAKPVMLEKIQAYLEKSCLSVVSDKPKANYINLVILGKNLQKKLDLFFTNPEKGPTDFEDIHHIVIENQNSPIANRMKTLQGMIAQYFIMRIPNPNIHFASSSNKLKDMDTGGKKTTYTERKKMGIQKCMEILSTPNYTSWMDAFSKHSKKDDLSDSFLQGIWFIESKHLI